MSGEPLEPKGLRDKLRRLGRDAAWPFLALAVFLTIFLGPLVGIAITLAAFLVLYSFELYWKYLLPLLVGLFLLGLAWPALAAHWKSFSPLLFILGFYAAIVGAGLLILYIGVRVVRLAWRHGETGGRNPS